MRWNLQPGVQIIQGERSDKQDGSIVHTFCCAWGVRWAGQGIEAAWSGPGFEMLGRRQPWRECRAQLGVRPHGPACAWDAEGPPAFRAITRLDPKGQYGRLWSASCAQAIQLCTCVTLLQHAARTHTTVSAFVRVGAAMHVAVLLPASTSNSCNTAYQPNAVRVSPGVDKTCLQRQCPPAAAHRMAAQSAPQSSPARCLAGRSCWLPFLSTTSIGFSGLFWHRKDVKMALPLCAELPLEVAGPQACHASNVGCHQVLAHACTESGGHRSLSVCRPGQHNGCHAHQGSRRPSNSKLAVKSPCWAGALKIITTQPLALQRAAGAPQDCSASAARWVINSLQIA